MSTYFGSGRYRKTMLPISRERENNICFSDQDFEYISDKKKISHLMAVMCWASWERIKDKGSGLKMWICHNDRQFDRIDKSHSNYYNTKLIND